MLTLRVNQNTSFKASPVQSISLPANQQVSVNAGSSFQVKHYQKQNQHYLVQLTQGIGSVGTSGFFFEKHVQIEEIRGVWITNVDSDMLESQSKINDGLQKLKGLGFNTIYPVVWNRGCALYPSAVAKQVIDPALSPVAFKDRDMLAEVVKEAKAQGFRVIPWFEYGLMTPSKSPLATNRPQWLTHDRHGNKEDKDSNFWLNPCHPEVQQFMAELISEVVEKYKEIDGVQLDDHFGMPAVMGYDSFTEQLYRQETGGADPATNPNSALWKQWRTDKITDLLKLIFTASKAKRGDCILSISPNPLGFSRREALADWQAWERAGFVEELVLQVYRKDLPVFQKELDMPEVQAAREHIPTVIGIITGLKPDAQRVSWERIKEQVEETRVRDFAGFSFFFYGSVDERFNSGLDLELNPQTELLRASRLQAFGDLLSTDRFV